MDMISRLTGVKSLIGCTGTLDTAAPVTRPTGMASTV